MTLTLGVFLKDLGGIVGRGIRRVISSYPTRRAGERRKMYSRVRGGFGVF